MRPYIFHFILFLTLSSPLLALSQNTFTRDQIEVNRTILLIGKAWSQNNLDTLEKYIAADYKHTDVMGQLLDRKAWLGYVAGRKEKHVVNPDITFERTEIKINGNFAFVTGVNSFSGSAYTGNDPNSQKTKKLRYTQVLKKEQGVWKRFLFQATYIE